MRESVGVYPAGIEQAFIHLVGTIVTWWARTEGIMVHDVRWLRTQPMSASIAAGETFPAQTKRMIKHWGKLLRNGYRDEPDQLEQLEGILNEAFALLEHRNTIVHSFWPYGQDNPGVIRLSSFKPKQCEPGMVEATTYTATVEQMDDLNLRMAHFYHRVMAFSFNAHRLANRDQPRVGLR